MHIEELKKLYNKIYNKLEKELQKHHYYDEVIIDELSSGAHCNSKHTIDVKYLPFLEYVTKEKRKYDWGYTAKELLELIQTDHTFSPSYGIEAPISLMCIYHVEGKLADAEFFFARDKYEAENDNLCTTGYKIGIGFDGKNFLTLNYRLSTGKIIKTSWGGTKSKDNSDDFKIVKGVLKKYTGNQSEVIIPNEVTSIGQKAFLESAYKSNSKLKSVILGESVTNIESKAFCSCVSLKNVTIPQSVIFISGDAFAHCNKLESISVDENNPNYISDNGNLYTKDFKRLLRYAVGKKDTHFTIPECVTAIGEYAFEGGACLVDIAIPNTVNTIADNAFAGCKKLECVTIPTGVTNISAFALDNCESITSVTIPNSVTSIGNCAFCNCKKLEHVTIPDSVTEIGMSAFRSCDSLTNVVIPNSVTSIGRFAFDCEGLISIDVDQNNTAYRSIDGNLYTFDGKTLITYVQGKNDTNFTVPDTVTTIGENAFYSCKMLDCINIPESVTSIGARAFMFCNTVAITISDSVMSIDASAFDFSDKVVIKAKKGSYAEKYATEHQIAFEAI